MLRLSRLFPLRRMVGVALLLLLTVASGPLYPQEAATFDRHVLLISIDGFAAYHLENPQIALPNIRRLAAEGARAEGSRTVFPSVTHPSHTTLITGVTPRFHGVVGNRMRDRRSGETFHVTNLPRSQSIRVPTVFDAAKEKGLTTAAFFWPETREDPAIDFNVAEVFDANGMADMSATNPGLIGELEAAGVPIRLYFDWYGEQLLRGAGDIILARAAAHVIRRHRPHLTAIHLLATDVMQHSHGPAHYLSHGALTNADYCVGILLEALTDAGIAANTTVIVTADHGFQTVGFELDITPLFEDLGDRIALHSTGWSLWVEKRAEFDDSSDGPLLAEVLKRTLATPGVHRVIPPGEMAELGLPDYPSSPYIPGHYLIMAEPDTHFTGLTRSSESLSGLALPKLKRVAKSSPYHGHGYLPGHPNMWTAFVASGRGVRAGARLGLIDHLSVAPTISRLLGIPPVGSPDRVLREMLSP